MFVLTDQRCCLYCNSNSHFRLLYFGLRLTRAHVLGPVILVGLASLIGLDWITSSSSGVVRHSSDTPGIMSRLLLKLA